MNHRADDWDDEERKVLGPLAADLEVVRARHENDPPLEVLRAADADVLPDDLAEAAKSHLQQSAWSRALVEGADAAEAQPSDDAARRLRARVAREAPAAPAGRPAWTWLWRPAIGLAAVLLLAVVFVRLRQPAPPVSQIAEAPAAAVVIPPPAYRLPLDKPDVRLTASALVFRSAGRNARFADDLAPALNAYRAGDYQSAAQQLAALEGPYPASVEVTFYLGVSRLFLNDARDAVTALEAARHLADDSFAADVAWYLAIAYERAGNPARARAELDTLCRGRSAYAARACDAAKGFGRE